MSHARQQVREAVGTVLGDTNTPYWNKVLESRITTDRDILPYLLVFIESETSTMLTIHPTPILERDMALSIQAHVRIPPDLETFEDTLDNVAAQVESKLTFANLKAQLGATELKHVTLTATSTGS